MEEITSTQKPKMRSGVNKNERVYVKLNAFSIKRFIDKSNTFTELSWQIMNNYPRLVIIPDTKNFDVKKQIVVPYDYITLSSYIDQFLKMIKEGKEDSVTMSSINLRWKEVNGKNIKTDEKYEQGRVKFGINAKGVAYIAVNGFGTEVYRFPLILDREWFKLFDSKGEPVEDFKVLSLTYACNYLKLLKDALSSFATEASTKSIKLIEMKPRENKQVIQDTPATVDSGVTVTEDHSVDLDDI